MVDLGLAKYYLVKPDEQEDEDAEVKIIKSKTTVSLADRTQHIQCKDGKSMVGTPRYASINCHLGL